MVGQKEGHMDDDQTKARQGDQPQASSSDSPAKEGDNPTSQDVPSADVQPEDTADTADDEEE